MVLKNNQENYNAETVNESSNTCFLYYNDSRKTC